MIDHAAAREWVPYSPCACGCDVIAAKLSSRTGHVLRCECASCRNRRNQRKGKAGQARMHRALGGSGWTPSNEESARPYEVTLIVMPESKIGAQVGATFRKFVESDFFRRALSQSERAAPVGAGVVPAVYVELSQSRRFLIADLSDRAAP